MTAKSDRSNPRLEELLEQRISAIAARELEAAIAKIVREVLGGEEQTGIEPDLPGEKLEANEFPQAFLETFGSWEDDRTSEEIIEDIYASRNFYNREYSQ